MQRYKNLKDYKLNQPIHFLLTRDLSFNKMKAILLALVVFILCHCVKGQVNSVSCHSFVVIFFMQANEETSFTLGEPINKNEVVS